MNITGLTFIQFFVKVIHLTVLIYVVLGGFFISNLSFIASPEWLPLPIDNPRDFVQTKDGYVYIAIMNNAVLQYDQSGHFVAAHKTGSMMLEGDGSDVQLAADQAGLLYVKIDDEVRVYQPGWQEVVEKRKTIRYKPRKWWEGYHRKTKLHNWRLTTDGSVEYLNKTELTYHDRLILPGELVFSKARKTLERQFYKCDDGTIIKRDGVSLVRLANNGTILSYYRTSWFLWPFRFAGFTGALVFGIIWFSLGARLWIRKKTD